MGKMSVIQSSTDADARCIVFCKSQANLLLRAENPKYEATLLKVFDDEGEVYYVWADVNPENAETAFKAVFAGEDEIIPSIEKIQPVKIGEAFNHQDDYYVLVQNHFGDQIIRRITVLSNEKMVRQILADDVDFKDICEIYVSKLFAIGRNKQFLTVAWAIVCSDKSITYLPVLDKDWQIMEEYDVASLLKESAKSGIPLKMHSMFYTPFYNSALGRWHIEQSKEARLIPNFV